MTCRIILIVPLLAILQQVEAQTTTAEAYFNQASKEYVKQDKMQALRTLDKALHQYPGDPRLLKLAEELVKEEQQQQQEQQQKEQQQQEQERQQKEQEKKEQEQAQQQKQQEQQEQERQQQQQSAQQGEEKKEEGEARPDMIAPQEAMRMLDALERSEKDVQEKVRVKMRPATRRSIQKDW